MTSAGLELAHEVHHVAEVRDGRRLGDLEAHCAGHEFQCGELRNQILEEALVVERRS